MFNVSIDGISQKPNEGERLIELINQHTGDGSWHPQSFDHDQGLGSIETETVGEFTEFVSDAVVAAANAEQKDTAWLLGCVEDILQ
jgi:hypothetical protein